MFVKRMNKDASGAVVASYMLAVRTQMGEAFAASRKAYAALPNLVEALAIDWGVSNFMTFKHELSAPEASNHAKGSECKATAKAKRHGVGFLKNEIEPILAKANEIEGKRQKLKAKHVEQSLRELFNSDLPKICSAKGDSLDIKDLFLLNESLKPTAIALHSGFDISTSKSRALRSQAKSKIETFIGTLLNHAVFELRPRAIVVELNRLISNAGRFFIERKLKDLHEKFGCEVYRVDAAYTSQECSACGHIHESNRKGELFTCKVCGHMAHADENAAECIGERHSLPGTCRLSKGKASFSWAQQGTLPRIPHQEFLLLKSAGIRFPALWAALRGRTPKAFKASAAAGSSAADDSQKASSQSKKGPPSVSKRQEPAKSRRPTINILEQS